MKMMFNPNDNDLAKNTLLISCKVVCRIKPKCGLNTKWPINEKNNTLNTPL